MEREGKKEGEVNRKMIVEDRREKGGDMNEGEGLRRMGKKIKQKKQRDSQQSSQKRGKVKGKARGAEGNARTTSRTSGEGNRTDERKKEM